MRLSSDSAVSTMRKKDDDFEDDEFESVGGSPGNIFRDFGQAATDVQQTKATLAASIIGILDDEGLSPRKAAARTGLSPADGTLIRNVRLDSFNVDRLRTVLNKLGLTPQSDQSSKKTS